MGQIDHGIQQQLNIITQQMNFLINKDAETDRQLMELSAHLHDLNIRNISHQANPNSPKDTVEMKENMIKNDFLKCDLKSMELEEFKRFENNTTSSPSTMELQSKTTTTASPKISPSSSPKSSPKQSQNIKAKQTAKRKSKQKKKKKKKKKQNNNKQKVKK